MLGTIDNIRKLYMTHRAIWDPSTPITRPFICMARTMARRK